MIDLKALRKEPEPIREALARRNPAWAEKFGEIEAIEKKRLSALQRSEELRSAGKKAAAEIGKAMKAGDKEKAGSLREEAGRAKKEAKEAQEALDRLEADLEKIVLGIPNPPDPSVPDGKDETGNRLVREGEIKPGEFSFKPKEHHEIGEALGLLDFETAGRLSGSRFVVLRGKGPALERALIQFMLDRHAEKGYEEVLPPYLVKPSVLVGTGQLPKFEDDQYKTGGEEDELFLIPTAEVPLTNLLGKASLPETEFPKKFVAHTPCFRREAGSYGKDTRGIIRQHQFNKVELVWLTLPEDSMKALESLTHDAEAVLEAIGVPYRIVELCAGDLGFGAKKTYDLEVWFPSQKKFREISSCSNCGDFQARRIGTRIKRENGKTDFAHTLNGSGVAVGRLFAALLENFQNEDGSVTLPEPLRPYLGGVEKLG